MRSKKFISNQGTRLAILAAILIVGSSVSVAGTYKTLYVFGGWGGRQPSASLILDAEGNLYGTTSWGGFGSAGGGTVFKLARNPDGSFTESLLHNFQCMDHTGGCSPAAALIFDAAGNLYGTTQTGNNWRTGGLVFELTPGSNGAWTESVLNYFAFGIPSVTSLIFDTSGNLYGTKSRGGNYSTCVFGCGTIFRLTPNSDGTWAESDLYTFAGGEDGAQPHAALIFDASGAIFGTTSSGGAYGFGNVFKLMPNLDGTWTENVVHQFTGGMDGAQPEASLIFDPMGNLYGTTSSGGAYGSGVVFKLTPNSDGTWTESVLHWFTGARDGAQPCGRSDPRRSRYSLRDGFGRRYSRIWSSVQTCAHLDRGMDREGVVVI